MIDRADVALVIPTRGDVGLGEILAAYNGSRFSDSYIWNNSADPDLGVYGRYAAIEKTDAPVILTQDDDVILPAATIQALLDAYEPGKVVCNIPERFRRRYTDSGMVGFGAIFDRELPAYAFQRFAVGQGSVTSGTDPEFLRTCDIVFTMLTPMIQVDLPYVELAYGKDESRMWRQPGHFEERDAMRKLCREVRDG